MHWSIRTRLAVLFTIAAATLFSVGGWFFVRALSAGLLSNLDSQLGTILGQASSYLPSASGPPAPTPGTSAAKAPPGEIVVQLVDGNGVVQAASHDAGSIPLLSPTLLRSARTRELALTSSSDGEPSRVVAGPFAARPGWVAIASVSLETYSSTMSEVFRELVIGGVVFVVVAGLAAYLLARAALSPVERLRKAAASISERDEELTLEVPDTGDEIASLATTMNELLSRLHRALERQRAFVADASHELRTPFAVLRGELELAGRPGRSKEELEQAIAEAAEEAARLTRLTEDLLLLARSDNDRLPLNLERTDVAALLDGCAAHARLRADAKGIMIRVEVQGAELAWIDADRIREALDNLIDNALRFAPSGSAIVLGASGDAEGITLSVSDLGPGFPDEFLPYAFERFRRPDRGRSRSDGGAGLGLAIVQAIAVSHGGWSVATNRPGGGAVVSIVLPAALLPQSAIR